MKRAIFFCFLFLSATIFAATKNISSPSDSSKLRMISIAGGFIKTSLNFFKNYQEETYSNGYSLRVLFQPSEIFRVAATYSKAEAVNIDPTWFNVNNSFYDLEGHLMMHFMDRRNLCYFILGASAQYWDGYYTGLHDLNNWKIHATPNSMYHALYFGAKTGMGAEIKIYGPISAYGEFLFRVTKTDVGFGLSDVVYALGLKVNVANLVRKSHRRHHSILHFRDKYHWF